MSTRRHALQPFTLSDGTRLEVGDWACTPVRALMQNPEHYPEPLKFNGFRFADPEILKKAADAGFGRKTMQKCPSKLTDVNDRDCSWHVWGTGRMAWYVDHPKSPKTHRTNSSICGLRLDLATFLSLGGLNAD